MAHGPRCECIECRMTGCGSFSLLHAFTPVRDMTDDAIAADLREFGEICPPPIWALARITDLRNEKRRRLISLDGDIGRRHAR